ncbi:MAG: NAD(P)H-dependent glycerol-3-phosphate dehydrogenase [Sulfitobacter sp.]
MRVSILGAGAFGTALAISLGRKGAVTLWARDLGDMAQVRRNERRLPGCDFPQDLSVTDDLAEACAAEAILLCVPMQKLQGFLQEHRDLLAGKVLVACCKGVELSTGRGPCAVIRETLPGSVAAILTGPSFAADIARGLPTALTLACGDAAVGRDLQTALTTDNLRIYRSSDTLGAELGGALKNVMAIACGAAMGAGFGESARAALMTRGFAEMQRLAAKLGAEPDTLAGLSGFGDLTLTCTSDQSRNYRLGLSLGAGTGFDGSTTVEGAATARAVDAQAALLKIELPIIHAVAAVLDGRQNVPTAMQNLLARPLKEE